jgi:CcmD family protein
MQRNRIALLLTLVFLAFTAGMAFPASRGAAPEQRINAQDSTAPVQVSPHEKEAQADAATALYRVMGVIMVIWIGLAAFLFVLDRRVAKLEKSTLDMK